MSSSSASSASSSSASTDKIDEDLYSRQLYVMGKEAQKLLQSSTVLVLGASGTSIEICKNVILAGVKSLTIYDEAPVTFSDLSTNFFLGEADIGKNRAEVCIPKLAELNPYVNVGLLNRPISNELLSEFAVVVLVQQPLALQHEICRFCHDNNKKVIVVDCRGVFGSIFCDFGQNFTVSDTTGQQEKSSLIAGIVIENDIATISNHPDSRHDLNSGDVVTISDISGLNGINGKQYEVKVTDPFMFQITLTEPVTGTYERGGYVNEVKKPTKVSFKSFDQTIDEPGMLNCDQFKYNRAEVLHLAFRAMHMYSDKHNTLPEPGNVKHADEIFDLVKEINASLTGSWRISDAVLNGNENYIKRFSMCCSGSVGPIAACIGGVAGQEVLKACSGKFMPIMQWAYFDFFECLPDTPLSREEVAPMNCRYDGQIQVFGRQMQQKLSQLSMFVVGAGAIGCEIMKNWAMMGIASDETKGIIHITDPDHIEKSNLSRQFLFRNKDIQKSKAVTAASAVQVMNPKIKVRAYEQKACGDTETFFNDDFFESLDMVCTALDNVDARLYIDNRCVFYHKPMLESGTLGPMGNTQIVVPRLTENYGATRDPPEKSFAACTIKTFPHLIEHTLQWAREQFEELYCQTSADTNMYLDNPSNFIGSAGSQQNVQLDMLLRIEESLLRGPRSFRDCIHWARLKFENSFVNNIKQLLHNFPEDQITTEGIKFWSGTKRPPTPLTFDASDPVHFDFIVSSALLRSRMFGINVLEDEISPRSILAALESISVPNFKPEIGVKIAANEEEAKALAKETELASDVHKRMENITKSLPTSAAIGHFRMNLVQFDKDVDDHMRIVAATSNLRARNYKIPEADLHRSRGIAGKIMPAIATTTSLVAGSICCEIYKFLQNKPLDAYSNSYYNLAVNNYVSMSPQPPQCTSSEIKGKVWKWNQWDRIDINHPEWTVGEMIDFIEEEYAVEVDMINAGVCLIYSSFLSKKIQTTRRAMRLPELIESVSNKKVPENCNFLVLGLSVLNAEGDEVDIPYVRFRIK